MPLVAPEPSLVQPAAATTVAAQRTATVVVTTDAPAVISIDGTARTGDLTREATLEVSPDVAHTVGAQRPGHSLHTMKVQPLKPGEQFPVTIKLR